MTAEDVVAGLESQCRPHTGALLAKREMRRSPVAVGDALIGALGLEGPEHGFELAHQHHVAQDVDQRRITTLGALICKGCGIGV